MISTLQVHGALLAQMVHQDTQGGMEIPDYPDILETMARKENLEKKAQ